MHGFEQLLGLFVAAVILAAAARRVGAPYPVFLAVGGALLAFLPIGSPFTLPPELALALFVAPVLLDAAYDASWRDLKDNWVPVGGLVIFAVGLTTFAVALVVRALVPGMTWAPAIARVPWLRRPMPLRQPPYSASCVRRTASSPYSKAKAC